MVLPFNSTKVNGFICVFLNDIILGGLNISKLAVGENDVLFIELIKKGDKITMSSECENFEGTEPYRVQLHFTLAK